MKACIRTIGLAAILATTCLASCDESDKPVGPPLIIMKANHFAARVGDHPVIIVTDSDGNILSKSNPNYAVDNPIYAHSKYDGDLVNLYLLSDETIYYIMYAFLNLKRGTEFIGPQDQVYFPPSKPVQPSFRNVKPVDYLTVSTDIYGTTIKDMADTATLLQFTYGDGGRLFGQMVSNGEGSYGFFDINTQTSKATLDFASLNSRSSKGVIGLQPGVTYSSFSLMATLDNDPENSGGYQLFSTWSNDDTDLDVYYPGISFARYKSHLHYILNDKNYFQHREGPTLDLNYEAVPFDASLVNKNPTEFKIAATGDLDFYSILYTGPDSQLTVYNARQFEEFSIPEFSGIKGMRDFPGSNWVQVSVGLYDYDGVTEGGDYFKYFSSGEPQSPRTYTTAAFGEPYK